MGYCVDVMDHQLTIPRESWPGILSTIKSGLQEGGELFYISNIYSRGTILKAIEKCDLEAVLHEFGYDFMLTNEMKLEMECRNFEKWYDDDSIWKAIAAYVDKYSYITFQGEDNSMWKYEFLEGEAGVYLSNKWAEIIWRD